MHFRDTRGRERGGGGGKMEEGRRSEGELVRIEKDWKGQERIRKGRRGLERI